MEDKKYWNTDEVKALGLDDLESVAGGYRLEELTDEERRTLEEYEARHKQSLEDYNHSKTTLAKHNALCREIREYKKMLCQKYAK